jgi:pyruvate dehydrogenase E1 component beta subunit
MAKVYLTSAVQQAFYEEMKRDGSVIVFGEDVKVSPYGYLRGLYEEFGSERVRNTPISENTLAGAAVGAAVCGLRPVVDLMTGNFLYTGMDQIANQAAKLSYMTGGQLNIPAVFIVVMGGGSNIAAQHSDSPHPVFMNLGGLKVVVPTTPADAKGLVKSAVRDDNPVMVLIPSACLGSKGEVPEGEDFTIPFGVADVKREGDDVTIVGIGSMLKQALLAAETLAEEDISAEVIDPRTLNPLDSESILDSVAKTGRLVVVDESRRLCSAASEIAAIVSEDAFDDLRAPVRRVTVPNVPMPFSPPLEKFVRPGADEIVSVAKRVAAH